MFQNKNLRGRRNVTGFVGAVCTNCMVRLSQESPCWINFARLAWGIFLVNINTIQVKLS